MEVIVVDIENRSRLDPEQRRRELKAVRCLGGPREEYGVDYAGERAASVCGGGGEIGDSLLAAAANLRQEVVGVVEAVFETVVVAIGVGSEGQSGESGRSFAHAAVGGNGGDEGDFRADANQPLGELKARVYVTLRRKNHNQESGFHHGKSEAWRRVRMLGG